MVPATELRHPRCTSSAHRVAAVAVAAVALLAAVVLPAPTAQATAYRYWSYWVGTDGPWSFSAQGAARVPQDGDVDGWRFAVSQSTGSSTPPRHLSDFESICGDTAAADGRKRVGVVIDFGTGTDAPPGQTPPAGPVVGCVVVASDANGYAVLDAVTSLRVDAGLICGIAGYPSTGCGEPVDDDGSDDEPRDPQGGATSVPEPEPSQDGSPAPEAAGRSAGSGSADPDQRTGAGGSGDRGGGDPTASRPGPAPSPATSVLAAPATVAGGEGGAPLGLLAGLLVVLGLGVAASVVSRRRP